MPNLTDAEILAIFKEHHPSNNDQLLALGVESTLLKCGTARVAYRLSDKLMVKFEFNSEGQSENEILCIRKINRKPEFKDLRKHIPKLYYGNKNTGALVMTYYPEASPYGSPFARNERRRLMEEFSARLNIIDLHEANFRMDENGYQVVIDLGWKGCVKNV